jgi:hypothetical protein
VHAAGVQGVVPLAIGLGVLPYVFV